MQPLTEKNLTALDQTAQATQRGVVDVRLHIENGQIVSMSFINNASDMLEVIRNAAVDVGFGEMNMKADIRNGTVEKIYFYTSKMYIRDKLTGTLLKADGPKLDPRV